eukprot:13296104-Alexandrium_andersonii.AAC.1
MTAQEVQAARPGNTLCARDTSRGERQAHRAEWNWVPSGTPLACRASPSKVAAKQDKGNSASC